MTWCAFKIDRERMGVELDVLLAPNMAVISRHDTYGAAMQAIADYRARQEREELEAAGQKGFDFSA